MEAFLPPIKKCWRSRDDAVRRIAASAAISVVDLHTACDMTTEFFSTLTPLLRESDYLQNTLKVTAPLVSFTWPADESVKKVSFSG